MTIETNVFYQVCHFRVRHVTWPMMCLLKNNYYRSSVVGSDRPLKIPIAENLNFDMAPTYKLTLHRLHRIISRRYVFGQNSCSIISNEHLRQQIFTLFLPESLVACRMCSYNFIVY